MHTKLILASLAILPVIVSAQDASAALRAVSRAMGGENVASIQYSGHGARFTLGQNVNPGVAWPRVELKSYSRLVDFGEMGGREEWTAGTQQQVQIFGRSQSWNIVGGNSVPAPATYVERLVHMWLSPHGVVRSAMVNNASVRKAPSGKGVMFSYTILNRYKVNGYANEQNLVEKVETWFDNPVLGDMPVEIAFSDYKDHGGLQFPGRIVQKQGGHPTLDVTITEVKLNPTFTPNPPTRGPGGESGPPPANTQKLADGVWYVTGGSHHSVAVEFKDHVVVIEAPQNDDRSQAVIEAVKQAIPNKPIRYLVNTHHHFDHSGGLRTYVAEGATLVTHKINQPFYTTTFQAPRSLSPDRMAKEKKQAAFLAVTDKHVFQDDARTLELHHIQGNPHNDGILLAYLPKEKLLVEADVFTPPAAGAAAPATPNPASVNLYENIRRLKLNVEQIAPLHGRVVPLADLEKAIGKAPPAQ